VLAQALGQRAEAPSLSPPGRDPGLPAACAHLACWGKQLDDLVFPTPGGGYLTNGNWRNRSGWRAAVMELGLTGVTPHDLRRTFGSFARSAGADLRWIQKAMGHESITTTARIYAHLYDDELDQVAAAIQRPAG
jgi:integrase